MAFTWKQNVKKIMQAGNSPIAREKRSKDHTTSRKTWITQTVKNSGAVILQSAWVLLYLSQLWQSFKSVSALVSLWMYIELSCPALCSDKLGNMAKKIWLCRTSSRCDLILHEALWQWLHLAFVDPEIHKDKCWLCTQPPLSSQALWNTIPYSVSELSYSMKMHVRIYVLTCKPSRSQGVFLWLVLYFLHFGPS